MNYKLIGAPQAISQKQRFLEKGDNNRLFRFNGRLFQAVSTDTI
jgi:succinylglutamate desuccinylase